MGFGAMEMVGKYPVHERVSNHPTALTTALWYLSRDIALRKM
jgi:hypothetical protein